MSSNKALSETISLESIYTANEYISKSNLVRRTPLLSGFSVPLLNVDANKKEIPVYLKMESLQFSGSFKIRGMCNSFRVNEERIRKHGAVTMSAGNAGRTFAFLCGQLGVKATVCMPNTVPADRVAKIKALGSDVELVPSIELLPAVKRHTTNGRVFIHPFDDRDLISGYGSIGIEILDDFNATHPDSPLGEDDVVAVCCGGGGLVSGVAASLKLLGCKASIRFHHEFMNLPNLKFYT